MPIFIYFSTNITILVVTESLDKTPLILFLKFGDCTIWNNMLPVFKIIIVR